MRKQAQNPAYRPSDAILRLDTSREPLTLLRHGAQGFKFVLETLRAIACYGAHISRQEIRIAEAESASSVAYVQEGRKILERQNFGDHYRAVATEEGGDFRWHWIGSHEEYNNLTS